ncbi:MAG: lysophospholipid acyltransferase family protein [Clostridia bacterium]
MYWLYKILLWFPLTILFPTIMKRKNIPKGKAILVCNHRSNMDVVVLMNKVWFKPNILAKKELFAKKCKRRFFKQIGGIPVDRENLELSTIKTCLLKLKNNEKLIIFPEGTRNKTEDNLQALKNGSAMLSIKSQSPIIPIWIEKKPKLFSFNKIIVGQPFFLKEFDKINAENLKLASNKISQKLLELSNHVNNK